MLKAAIIGCGSIATVHKRVLELLDKADLVACCDIKKEKAEEFAKGTDMHVYESVDELINNEELDVVHLCIPHPLHTPIAKKCVEAGINVFTEKPPVVNKEQLEDLYGLKESGKYVGICFQNRYNQATVKVKEMLDNNELGKVLGAKAFLTWYREKEYYTESDWKGSWETEGGGVLINQAIHTLDLLVYLLGNVKDVDCHMCNHSLNQYIEVEDTTEAFIKFESGVNALFYATNAYCYSAPVFIEIACEKGILRMEGNTLTLKREDGTKETYEDNAPSQFKKDYWGNSHYICIEDFYSAITENRPYKNNIDSVMDTMKLMLKMYEPFTGKKTPRA